MEEIRMIVRTIEIRNHVGLHAYPSYLLSAEAGTHSANAMLAAQTTAVQSLFLFIQNPPFEKTSNGSVTLPPV